MLEMIATVKHVQTVQTSPNTVGFKRSDLLLNQLLSPDWTERLYGRNSSQSNGVHIHVEECTLAGVEVVDSFSNDYERVSHMAFTLICFIFICFFSSFFCSRRWAAS